MLKYIIHIAGDGVMSLPRAVCDSREEVISFTNNPNMYPVLVFSSKNDADIVLSKCIGKENGVSLLIDVEDISNVFYSNIIIGGEKLYFVSMVNYARVKNIKDLEKSLAFHDSENIFIHKEMIVYNDLINFLQDYP